MSIYKLYQIGRILVVLAALLGVIFVGAFATAQEGGQDEDDFVPSSIELTSTINSIDGNNLTVGGLPVDVSMASVDGELTVGTVVTVRGVITENGIIRAETVTVVVEPTPTPELTQTPALEATSTPSAAEEVVVIEGTVNNINANVIEIQNIRIVIAPNNPILNLIQIVDVIRIEGVRGANGVIRAVVVNTVIRLGNVAPGATVSVQGPIESINGNIVVVNGITIQLDPNDPQLNQLRVGNFIDAQGSFVIVNNRYVLVAVNFFIINNTYVGIPPYCHWHGMGGMERWHCEGYWLYPPNYWYCEWRAMGMGMGMVMGMGMGMSTGYWECVNPAPITGMGAGN